MAALSSIFTIVAYFIYQLWFAPLPHSKKTLCSNPSQGWSFPAWTLHVHNPKLDKQKKINGWTLLDFFHLIKHSTFEQIIVDLINSYDY